jgi:hypothetical protein
VPSNLPVSAGFRVSGDEKNCEKCGSCAFTKNEKHISMLKIAEVFFIFLKKFRLLKVRE